MGQTLGAFHPVLLVQKIEKIENKIHRKTQACNFIKKETMAQVFSSEVCEISNTTVSYRTPLVADSDFSKYSIKRCCK